MKNTKARFLTLDKHEMCNMIWEMLLVNHNQAWNSYREWFDSYDYEYRRIEKIFTMCCDWNSEHDSENEEIFMFESYDETDENGNEIIRIYLEDDFLNFPKCA